jgi:transposase InsO family protein
LHIPTTGPPVHSRARRLPPEKLTIAKDDFEYMEKAGIIRRSKSKWSSPLHMALKPDGINWRPCGDYRVLNTRSEPDRYPVPHVQDFSAKLHGTNIFSKVDMVRGYHQIPVAACDIEKTAVITPFGLFEFLRTPFGLKNAAQAFQRLMDTVCRGLDFAFVYLDDILVASNGKEQHLEHLRQLFERFKDHGLILNQHKCRFGHTSLDFLGHLVTPKGIAPTAKKVEAIKLFPAPKSPKELQRFVGMVNFYHRFLRGANKTLYPLISAMRLSPKEFQWTSELNVSFEATKQALGNATLLNHYTPGAKLALTTDASDVAVGAVLEQCVKGQWQPLSFFSSRLRGQKELTSSAFDRELKAAYLAVRHFRYMLEARPFTIYTDHKPLLTAMVKVTDPWSAVQIRHLTYISEYTTDFQHLEGKKNVVADALSRIEINAVHTGIDYEQMARDQLQDPELPAYRTAITNLRFEDVQFSPGGAKLCCDTSTGTPRPLVPAIWRKRVFDILHGLSHPGVRTSQKIVAAKFVWHGQNKQVGEWARQCIACQRAKVQTHTRAPLQEFAVPDKRFSHLNIDIVGPLPPSRGFTHLLTIVDRFTRWPVAIPINDTSAASCASALIHHWISNFGMPDDMSSDRGTQFISEFWAALAQLLGTSLHKTTSYHPQANGLVERFHRSLKASLAARLTGPSWFDELPWVMLGIRTAPKEDLGASPAELVFGSPLTVPGEFLGGEENDPDTARFLRQLRERVDNLTPTPTSAHGSRTTNVPDPLQSATFVFVRKDGYKPPLSPKYDGPFKVLERGPKVFKLQLGTRTDLVSIDRLKTAITDKDSPVRVAMPPRRGRPPGQSAKPISKQPQKKTTTTLPPTQTPTTTKRSGREVKKPSRYQ